MMHVDHREQPAELGSGDAGRTQVTMQVTTVGAQPAQSAPQLAHYPPPPPARTGAFADVRARWLLAFAVVGTLLISALVTGAGSVLGGASNADAWSGILLYLPIVAWVVLMVGRRAGVNVAAMFRWPRLGWYWLVVAGMLLVQFVFSLGAITLTQLIAPGLDDSLEGVGQGNLLLVLLGLVILPPLVEETVFRGVLIERFAVKWSLSVGIVVSAILFGILHADPVGAGVFGVITALLYLRTGSLWPGILIHGVNNLVALVAMRTAGDSPEPLPADTGEVLISAGIFLALSVPFIVWFIWTHWPRRGRFTPYQGYELATGLPERHFDTVAWSAAPTPVRVNASATHVVAAPPGHPAAPLALLPVEQVRAAYTSPIPGGEQVVVLVQDGSWTTMRAGTGKPKEAGFLARTITERAAQARYRSAVAQQPGVRQR